MQYNRGVIQPNDVACPSGKAIHKLQDFSTNIEEKVFTMMLETQVDRAIHRANLGVSGLNEAVLDIEGMSSPKVRHFLNNLTSFPTCRYLEVGSWKGSTFISALYNNQFYDAAWSVENWSEFGGPKVEFHRNVELFLPRTNKFKLIEADFAMLNPTEHGISDVNVYFYDGSHDERSQYLALTQLHHVLTDQFIFVCDDWNHEPAREGTFKAIDALKLEIHQVWELSAAYNGDKEGYWNGLGVFVLEKSDE